MCHLSTGRVQFFDKDGAGAYSGSEYRTTFEGDVYEENLDVVFSRFALICERRVVAR